MKRRDRKINGLGRDAGAQGSRASITQHQAKSPNDATFDALIASHRQGVREAKLGAQLEETSAFLLPLMLALSRLAACRDAAELAGGSA